MGCGVVGGSLRVWRFMWIYKEDVCVGGYHKGL